LPTTSRSGAPAFENGLLIVDLVREILETMKPRRIAIGGPSAANQIEATAA
jgi:molecular chaperone IbpA